MRSLEHALLRDRWRGVIDERASTDERAFWARTIGKGRVDFQRGSQ